MSVALDDDGRAEHAEALVAETLDRLTRWLRADAVHEPEQAAVALVIHNLVEIAQRRSGVLGAVSVAESAVLCSQAAVDKALADSQAVSS